MSLPPKAEPGNERPLRILLISNTNHDPNQGSGYVITNIVQGLRDRGHLVDAYSPEDYVSLTLPKGNRYTVPLQLARFGLKQARENTYDVIELWGGDSWLLARLLDRPGRSYALIHHSNGIEAHDTEVTQRAIAAGLLPPTPWYRLNLSSIHGIGLRSSDAILTVSEYDAEFVRSKGYVPPDQVYAIDNPLPSEYLGLDLSLDRPNRIGFCGTWIPRKGTELMLSDLPPFLRAFPDWTFSLVGVGTETDIHAQFPADVRDQIEVTPFLPRSELRDWYQTLAIVAVPSIYESFGLVQTEGMACGAALAATPVGFAATLTDRETAYLLPMRHESPLFDALSHLASDDALRRKIAANGYHSVQSLQWHAALDRIESIFSGLCSAKSPRIG